VGSPQRSIWEYDAPATHCGQGIVALILLLPPRFSRNISISLMPNYSPYYAALLRSLRSVLHSCLGCTISSICPDATVTRGQMQCLLFRVVNRLWGARALKNDAPSRTIAYFTDDRPATGSSHTFRNQGIGITSGCTLTTIGPNDTLVNYHPPFLLAAPASCRRQLHLTVQC